VKLKIAVAPQLLCKLAVMSGVVILNQVRKIQLLPDWVFVLGVGLQLKIKNKKIPTSADGWRGRDFLLG
jgi:hypothetical protein